MNWLSEEKSPKMWDTWSLGNKDHITDRFAASASFDKRYGWLVRVYSGENGFGESFYYHTITFIR